MILHLLALLPNFDFYLRLHIKFHKLLFWVPISAAGGPYWVLIAKKLGPYLKAWGSLLVLETVVHSSKKGNEKAQEQGRTLFGLTKELKKRFSFSPTTEVLN